MPEIRQNIAIQEWVIIATERAKRPEDFLRRLKPKAPLPEYSKGCPFCPGNEHLAPPETFSIKDERENWKVRVVPNKYAALSAQGPLVCQQEGIKHRINGVGIHEVIIETPKHNMSTALFDNHSMVDVLTAYKERYLASLKDGRIEMVTIFKNHGESAGTSLEHPHSQLIATPIIPSHVRHRLEIAQNYYNSNNKCVFCKMIEEEISLQERIVLESHHFIAFIPYGALSPFHVWILPKRHTPCFPQINEEKTNDLAYTLSSILKKLYIGLDDPDFNYVLRSLPGPVRENHYFHFYFSIIPRVTKIAGFEMGSGMFINTALPEESAEFLRNIAI